jgi:hypothetical protein
MSQTEQNLLLNPVAKDLRNWSLHNSCILGISGEGQNLIYLQIRKTKL